MSYGGDAYGGTAYGAALLDDSEAEATSIEMGGALGDTLAFGPDFFTDESGFIVAGDGSASPPLSVELVDIQDIGTVLSTLPSSFDREFTDEANDVGTGTLAVANTDDLLPDLQLDRMITYSVYGNRAYSMLIESMHRITYSQGEEYDQITSVVGRGHLSIIERAVLYPSRGPDVQPIQEDRTFNWSAESPVYDDSAWGNAYQICTVGTAQVIWPSVTALNIPFAEGWTDLTTGVIWAPGSTINSAPAGFVYFRKDVTIPIDGFYILEAACDNEGEMYLDGQKILDLQNFLGTFSYTVYITAGPHTIAVVGQNYEFATTNPAGLIMALYVMGVDGEPATMLFHTDSSWKIVAYPATAPGMYVGEVLHYVWSEAAARVPPVENWDLITLMFTEFLDSAGNPWPETLDISTKVGTSYLVFLIELTATYIDLWMKPGTFELYAWNKGTRRRVSGVSLHGPTDELDPETGNMFEQTHTLL